MHPNLHTTHIKRIGLMFEATQDILVHWPEPDLQLLQELGAQRCNNECWQLPYAQAHRLPPGLSLGWVYNWHGAIRLHPARLIVRKPEGHCVIQLQPHEALQDYFYPGHPETNFVVVHLDDASESKSESETEEKDKDKVVVDD